MEGVRLGGVQGVPRRPVRAKARHTWRARQCARTALSRAMERARESGSRCRRRASAWRSLEVVVGDRARAHREGFGVLLTVSAKVLAHMRIVKGFLHK